MPQRATTVWCFVEGIRLPDSCPPTHSGACHCPSLAYSFVSLFQRFFTQMGARLVFSVKAPLRTEGNSRYAGFFNGPPAISVHFALFGMTPESFSPHLLGCFASTGIGFRICSD